MLFILNYLLWAVDRAPLESVRGAQFEDHWSIRLKIIYKIETVCSDK